MKHYYKPLLAFLLFILTQGLVSVIGTIVIVVSHPEFLCVPINKSLLQQELLTPSFLSITLIVSSLLTILFLKLLKIARFRETFSLRGLNFRIGLLAVAATVPGIFATNLLSEMLALPDIITEQLAEMSNTVGGFLAIAVVGPICEEFVFRESILGYSLRKGAIPWQAVCFSSLLFGLVHMNPAQIPFAFFVGLMLGYVYLRTGNIVLSSLIHIINNSASCLIEISLGEDSRNFSFTGLWNSTLVSVAVLLVCAAVSIYLFLLFKKSTTDMVTPWRNSCKNSQESTIY